MKRDDEMAVQDHPHVDQRNWQPGDDDDAGPTLERFFAIPRVRGRFLRTLERMRLLTGIPPEMLAAVISPHIRIDQLVETKMYLEDVIRCIGNQMQWKCAECGQDIWCALEMKGGNLTKVIQRARRDARYCSPSCRQTAYRKRKRVTANPSDTKA